MNYSGLFKIIGAYLFVMSLFLGIGLAVCIYFEHYLPVKHPYPNTATGAFLITLILCFITAIISRKIGISADKSLQLKEAILSVVVIWILTILFSALPFRLSGVLSDMSDACFEAVSGLTTTGATLMHPKSYGPDGIEIPIHKVFYGFQKIEYSFYGTVTPIIDPATKKIISEGVEALPKGILFWRSFTNWIGGLGVVLLFVALLPAIGERGKVLFRYESTGPLFSPLFPQARKTSIVLFEIYLGITALCIIFLLIVNPAIGLFDSIAIAFSALSTGGFSTKNSSIAFYNSLGTEVVTMIFMVAGATNFALYYHFLRGKFFKLFEPEAIMFYLLLITFCIAASLQLVGESMYTLTDQKGISTYSLSEAFRYGSFQIISSMTNTGFCTINYDLWPFFSQNVMISAMYFGGMAGSTCGGLKIIRVLILFQCIRYVVKSIFRRNEIRSIRVGNRDIDQETAFNVLGFFLIVISTSLIGITFLVFSGIDPETALGLNACMINNTGLAFRMAGPVESCAFLSFFPKFICMAWMLLGRLEYYIWFVLFLPSFWRKD